MTETAERLALAEQAADAWARFVGPALDHIRGEYMTKLIELAARAQDDRSVQGIRNLSIATRIVAEVEAQMRQVMADGEAAKRDAGRASTIANMSSEARRFAAY